MVPHVLFMMLGAVFHLGITVYGEPSMKANLTSLHIISDIKYRFATTQISMKYYNPYNSAVTADLYINMPRNSFISNFSMEIDGNVTVGEVKKKSFAKDIFEDAIQTGQSAGYIEVKHRFTNVFDISVNVEPHKDIVYNLTYQELLERQDSKYRHILHLSNGGIIDDFLVEVFITEPQDIINLTVPNIKDDKLTNIDDDGELNSTLIEYSSSKEVYIKYNPSREEQEEISKNGIAGLLRVEYDVDRKNNSNLIYAVDGYFVHFFTPDSLPNLPKHIVFILDVSNSMSGRKIQQLKEAMENILDKLDPELDKFILGKFNDKVSFIVKTFFLTANRVNKKLGKDYIRRLDTSGATNINNALLESIKIHKSVLSPAKKSIIIFLTDGQPTSGITDIERIKRNVKEANKNISLFALCFGDNCDSKFLREIATENGGFNRKIYVDSDSKLQIENLYKEISNILIKDIKFVYLNEAVNTSATSFSSYFKGSEIVVSGVLAHQNQSTMNVNLTMTTHRGPDNEILELEIYEGNFTIDDDHLKNPNLTNIQSFSEITEKTYVYLTLKQLLKEDRTMQVRKDILHLALKYNFVTPLTSMVVTKSRVKEKLFEEDDLLDFIPSIAALDMGMVMPTLRFSRLTSRKPKKMKHSKKRARPPPQPTLTSVPRATKDILLNIPGIFIKPFACSNSLCLTHHISCQVSTRILLLANFQANLFVHAFVKRSSQNNCLDTINRVILKKKRRLLFEVTADRLVKNGKEINISNKTEINLNLKNFLSLKVFKTKKTAFSETFLSLHFTTLKKITRARGILKKYIAKSSCPHEVRNVLPKFKVNTNNPEINHCYFTT